MAERKPKPETVELETADIEQSKPETDSKPWSPVTRLKAWPKPIVRQRPEA